MGGFLYATIEKNLTKKRKPKKLLLISIVSIFYFLYSVISYNSMIVWRHNYIVIFETVLPALTSVFTIYILWYIKCISQVVRSTNKLVKILAQFGYLTYAFYLLHAPVVGAIAQANQILEKKFIFLAALIFSVILSWISYYGIEIYFHRSHLLRKK